MISPAFTSEPFQRYDYIVVGGGSAGCIVAARLAEEGASSVLLIEAGNAAEKNPDTLSADGFVKAFGNDNTMWDRLSVPQPGCAGRRVYVGTGTGMGGGGAVNGMVYTRGDKRDYDAWPVGWRWSDLAPAYDAIEARLRVRSRPPVRFTDTGIEAACSAGFQQKNGLNDGELCGYIGYQWMNYEGDQRRSSYAAFLHNKKPGGLVIKTDMHVSRIVFDEHRRAVGVEVIANGHTRIYNARREIILCAGALETPKLLMLSGVGPRDLLASLDIPIILDAPYIGKHLQDHPNVCLFYRGRMAPDAFYPQVYGFERVNPALPLSPQQPDTCFVFYSAPASLQGSMYRMLPALALPPAYFRSVPLRKALRRLIDIGFAVPFTRRFVSKLFGIVVILGKPLSRGEVRIASRNPLEAAEVDPGFYRDPRDMETLINGVLKAQEMARQPGFVRWGNRALSKGARTESREALRRWIQGATMTTFHFCGSCRMGDDVQSPVDVQLRVKGVTGLRVADASVVPEIPVSALNAPSMLIGYRAAEFLLQERMAEHHASAIEMPGVS